MTNDERKSALVTLAQKAETWIRASRDMIEGRRAIFVSDFNGQQFGRSRPSLKGKMVVIECACWDDHRREMTLIAGRTEDGTRINAGFLLDDIQFLE